MLEPTYTLHDDEGKLICPQGYYFVDESHCIEATDYVTWGTQTRWCLPVGDYACFLGKSMDDLHAAGYCEVRVIRPLAAKTKQPLTPAPRTILPSGRAARLFG